MKNEFSDLPYVRLAREIFYNGAYYIPYRITRNYRYRRSVGKKEEPVVYDDNVWKLTEGHKKVLRDFKRRRDYWEIVE